VGIAHRAIGPVLFITTGYETPSRFAVLVASLLVGFCLCSRRRRWHCDRTLPSSPLILILPLHYFVFGWVRILPRLRILPGRFFGWAIYCSHGWENSHDPSSLSFIYFGWASAPTVEITSTTSPSIIILQCGWALLPPIYGWALLL